MGQAPAPPTRPEIPFEGRAPAPDFPAALEWLNTAHPLSLADLRGKIVLLDFWTYCCINCMHIIPDLKKLEAKYAKELVVIGVHSAKFQNEKETANIREAVQRYEIEHPVANDKDFLIWKSYGARAWPTLVLINPNGKVIGGHSGEGIYDLFDQVISATVKHFDAKGELDRRPIQFQLEKDAAPRSVLSYPGKIAAHGSTQRLFFTDSNHNRVIVSAFDGQILECIGEGAAGLKDGSFEAAQFFRPQGLCFDPASERIFVADTENHAIRAIDLKSKTVSTLAGTGRQARRHGQEGQGVELNSPWDLILVGETLYIAMAGPHQIWTLDTKTLEARVFAGSGRENIVDGPLKEAALAQPSGITSDGAKLYFADSEVSAVRFADLDTGGKVETLIGKGLFDFGDVDGKFPEARLQHCLGVAYHNGVLYVADTYNHKIKKLNPKTKEVGTFIGTGRRGALDGPALQAELNEPSGVCIADNKLFIADANNHLIRVCDLKTSAVSTLIWKGLKKLSKPPALAASAREVQLEGRKVALDARSLEFRLSLPKGKKLNPAAQSTLKVESDNSDVVRFPSPESPLTKETTSLELSAKPGSTKFRLHLTVYYCDAANEGLCYFDEVKLVVPLEVTTQADARFVLSYALK
jgi:thiol-disulfide isomerase/thioredoxin